MDKHTIASALNETFGARWSFEIVGHTTVGATIEVIGELRADGQRVRETGRANGTGTLGERLEAASHASLEHCARALLNGALPEQQTPTPAPISTAASASVGKPAPVKGNGAEARTPAPATASPSSRSPTRRIGNAAVSRCYIRAPCILERCIPNGCIDRRERATQVPVRASRSGDIKSGRGRL